MAILKAFPQLCAIVQDIPSVTEQAIKASSYNHITVKCLLSIVFQFWQKELPDAVVSQRIKLQGSYFRYSPEYD